ncbi:ABC-F family ATP-binding cassette domain-containing protein [Flavobacteriaceae bacterium]|nr:ABC-F family ATP-binding cassette domain-containing protein [Flavobacteriaceae bacterium]MDB4212820.1 ABC-F family ATP-binding cassette domain-containing protein [Flavobacteriaceae bacterium]MDC1320675.1 ABC-F family ATP-binding cassette domain-containing protein [Flavobacteriaceae bacterium]
MNYLNVENISKSYGEVTLFEGVSFSIHKGQKIAFIAKNGTGKTSILKIISGEDTCDSGEITYRKNIAVSFLSQDPKFNDNLTIEESIFNSDNPILKVISNYEKAILNSEDTENYQKAFEEMELFQAWDFETQYKQILYKLKLDKINQKVKELSGGQKKRLSLANALINRPDLLILDEPTNHLDLEMIEWLESFFAKENITLFMVTHDRYFLERVCNEIIELDHGVLHNYKGNYSYYLDKREARIERQAIEQGKVKQLFKKELTWMRKQPKARTTKSKSRIDDFKEIKHLAQQRRNDHEVQLELNMERLGTKIVEFYKVSMFYDDKTILNKYSYQFQRGERVGIIGKNGTGKSTFLDILTGKTAPESGKIIIGETIKFGYYTQNGIKVKNYQKVIDVVRDFGDYIPLKKGKQISAQQLLERFLFSRQKQYDFVEKLSGGERKRLYLCTVLIQNPNFLILDEPTNDLDIVTLNVLESFLLDFPGCVIVVSHDRYFMDKVVDHLLVFKGEGGIEDFPGNYSDYRSYEDSRPYVSKKEISDSKTWKEPAKNKLSYNEEKELKNIESKIKTLNYEKKEVEKEFLQENLSQEKILLMSGELEKIIAEISAKEERWFMLSSKLEE